MEINAIANIYTDLMIMKQDGKIANEDFERLEFQIFAFREYCIAIQKDPSLQWHSFLQMYRINAAALSGMEGNDTILDWTAMGIDPDQK